MFSRPPFYDDRCSRFPNYFVPYVPYPTLLVPLVGDEDVFPIFFFDDGWMDGIISCLERYPPPPPLGLFRSLIPPDSPTCSSCILCIFWMAFVGRMYKESMNE